MKIRTEKKRKAKITVIGGGTGLPVILKSLKNIGADVTGIVTVADDGGSSGKLRELFGAVPPGDIRNALISLSELSEFEKTIFQYRFDSTDEKLDGHSIGNLIIQAAADVKGNIYQAIQLLSKMMQVQGHVYPAAEIPLILNARYKDGSVGAGESQIAHTGKLIDYVTVSNAVDDHKPIEPGRNVVRSIQEADAVVLGPGSLYTSILPNLMIPDLGQAVLNTKAKVIYICNIMTQKGETENFSDCDHVKVLHRHLNKKFIDIALINNVEIPKHFIETYCNDEYLVQVRAEFEKLSQEVPLIISENFLNIQGKGIYHDGNKVAKEILHCAKNIL